MGCARILATVALSCLACGSASAGVVVTLETDRGEGGKPSINTMSIESDRLRMADAHGGMIYREDLGKAWILDAADHTYRELTPQSMQQMRTRMAGAMAQMQQQLQSMPPEQRKHIEAMMAQRGAPMGSGQMGQPAKITYEKAGDSRTVGQWPCTPYKMMVNGTARSEMCIAKLSDVGITRDDMKAFVSLGTFMQQGMAGGPGNRPPAGVYDFDSMSKAIGFDGIPVETSSISPDGKTELENRLESVEHTAIPASTFELPAGYTKQEMPMMGGPGHMPPGARPPEGRPPAE